MVVLLLPAERILLCCSGKQPNWNRFQNKLPLAEGRELYHFLLHCFDVRTGKNTIASQRNISFWSIGYVLSMDFVSKHKDDDSDNGWVLDPEKTGEEESEIVPENVGSTAMLTVEMWAFLSGFSCYTQTLLLLAPVLLGPGEATYPELLGMKRVKMISHACYHMFHVCGEYCLSTHILVHRSQAIKLSN